MWDALWNNANLVILSPGQQDFGILKNAALAVKAGKIAWLGLQAELKSHPKPLAHKIYDCQGQWLTPGLIDCHTHIIYAGNRYHEFEQRLLGKTYAEIAKAGGGILSTVKATREASFDELYYQSSKRLISLIQEGVTTVEIKSGYGLDLDTEIKMLQVARQLARDLPITIKTTLLAAHTIPTEYVGRADNYIDTICDEMIPKVAAEKLADAVDVFCEHIGFTPIQTERIFIAAKKAGLSVKIHAEQLSDLSGAALAAKYQALSADHLEYASLQSIKAMAEADTVAVLLPGAFYFLQETQKPPVKLLREYKVPIAIATDCNPGSSPTTSLLLMLNMSSVLFNLTPLEAWQGITCHAAQALGIASQVGSLAVGKQADFVVWDISHPIELCAQFGTNPPRKIIKNGIEINLGELDE